MNRAARRNPGRANRNWPMHAPTRISLGLAFALLAVTPAAAQMQAPGIQPELLTQRRDRPEGAIQFCVNAGAETAPLDRAVGQALGDILLADISFVDIETDFAVNLDYIIPIDEQQLYIQLYSRCDAVLGYAYAPASLPPWLTISRPYASTGFVAVVLDDAAHAGIEAIGDLPRGVRIGGRLGSAGDTALLRYLGAQNDPAWRRLSYTDHRMAVERLADGTLDAAILWEPAYRTVVAQGLVDADLRVIDFAPVPEGDVAFGAIMMLDDTFLRGMLDDAITALHESGTFDALVEETGIPAGPPQ